MTIALTLAFFSCSASLVIAWYTYLAHKRIDAIDTKDLRRAFEHLERSCEEMWASVNSHLGRISRLKRTIKDDKFTPAATVEGAPQVEAAPQMSKGEPEVLPLSRTELLMRARR